MTALESLYIDFNEEINKNDFGNKRWEDDSYAYMTLVVETYDIDKTIKNRIFEILDDKSVSLPIAYMNVCQYLYLIIAGEEQK